MINSEELLARDPHYLSGGWLAAKLAAVASLRHLGWSFALALLTGSVGASALLVVGALTWRDHEWSRWSKRHLFPLTPFILFSIGQLIASVTLYHDGYSFARWYFVVQPWLDALFLGTLIETGRQWRMTSDAGARAVLRPVVSTVSWLLILASLATTARSLWAWESRMRVGLSPAGRLAYEPLYAAALWLRDTKDIPSGAVIGACNAGAIAYLSGRTVVNLDGLVNSWEFARARRKDLCTYWSTKGITHLVDVWSAAAGPGRRLPFMS